MFLFSKLITYLNNSMNLIEHFINGKIVPGVSERKGKVFNPAIGKQESEVRLASAKDLDLAVQKAKTYNALFKETSTTTRNLCPGASGSSKTKKYIL